MAGIIQILPDPNQQNVHIGELTNDFIQRQVKLTDSAKESVMNEAVDILRHCVAPGVKNTITHLAIGYVQSGKTLSFTTLTTLAADNGYRIVIYLTGNKNNLKNQTSDRLREDLSPKAPSVFQIFDDLDNDTRIKQHIENLSGRNKVLLFPILKHSIHIEKLAKIFTSLNSYVRDLGIIIVDDEADQASLNTFARKNATNADWDNAEQSTTYSSILALRASLPSHSYIQYTATPQAPLLINPADSLSPKHHTVLTPGDTYTGGKVFFQKQKNDLIIEIPPQDVYTQKTSTRNRPETFERALYEFFITVAIGVYIQKRIDFLSMMVHIDGLRKTNELFYKWTNSFKSELLKVLSLSPSSFFYDSKIKPIQSAYMNISRTVKDCPTFEDVLSVLTDVVLESELYLVQSGQTSEIKWKSSTSHILVGADMLNRGFTIEHLSMSYMPRHTKSKSNADTIEQRCRFFGYKRDYLDLCRVYLPYQSIQEFELYVKHEEAMRKQLKDCNDLERLANEPAFLLLSNQLNPTRSNVLSSVLQKDTLCGWKQFQSLAGINNNTNLVNTIIRNYETTFKSYGIYNNVNQEHRYIDCDIDEIIQFIKAWDFENEVTNVIRKKLVINYLQMIKNEKDASHVRLVEMAYQTVRTRKLGHNGLPINLQMGHSQASAITPYEGDKYFKSEEHVTIQIHHIKIKDDNIGIHHQKELYNLAIYFPEIYATDFVSVAHI